jgi:hypothetical protein
MYSNIKTISENIDCFNINRILNPTNKSVILRYFCRMGAHDNPCTVTISDLFCVPSVSWSFMVSPPEMSVNYQHLVANQEKHGEKWWQNFSC